MKNKIIVVLTITVLLLCIFTDKIPQNNLSLEYSEDIGVYTVNNPENKSIISKNYQRDISKLIYNKLNSKLYLAKEPLMILNPYGTNITGLYINFFTLEKSKIEYTISVEDESIPDYTNTLNGGLTNFHKGQIIGLLQGYENILTIKLIDKYNKINQTYEFKINVPDYKTETIKNLSRKHNELNEISDGLYVFCSVRNLDRYQTLPISFYDKNGIIRAEFTKESGLNSFRLELVDNKLLYAIEPQTYVVVNHLGKIEKIYKTKYYSNHELIYYKYDNSLFYITHTDKIRKLNLNNNSDTLLIDLGELLKEYKEKAIKYHKENYNYYEELYWSHLNSVEIVNENDVIISARENSSIIYISNIYDKPQIKYIIAPETIYENTQYKKYLLTKEGNFTIHAGQHDVRIQKDPNLKQGQYYLTFYNNNYAPPDHMIFNIGWDKIIEGVGKGEKNAENSAYYKYLVDEKEKTFTLVDSIKVPYSRMISNVQILDNGYLINSGYVGLVQEYNENKKIILQLQMPKNHTTYRVYKQDMKNFWFDNISSYIK